MTKKTIVVEADLLSELASDLEDYLRLTYDTTYLSEARRFEREMEPVNRARELLKEQPPWVQVEPDYPECSGDPASCPENEGRGCCNPNPKLHEPVAFGISYNKETNFISYLAYNARIAQDQISQTGGHIVPLYTAPPTQTIDAGKVHGMISCAMVAFESKAPTLEADDYRMLRDEIAKKCTDQIASLVGCEQNRLHPCGLTHEQIQAAHRAALSLGENISSSGVVAIFEAIALTRPPEPESNDEN